MALWEGMGEARWEAGPGGNDQQALGCAAALSDLALAWDE